jgi:hypothetical protein
VGQRYSRNLSAAQQYLALRSSPISEGSGSLGRGRLVWTWQVAPSALSRLYTLKLLFKEGGSPKVFVEEPDLVALAEGRKIPHLYSEAPVKLCLYLPGSGEWHSGLLIAKTIIPWAALWLYFFEEWLISDEWKGGGQHPIDTDSDEHDAVRRTHPAYLQNQREDA